ncbi:hypothetical protein ABFS83_04G124700 [Erythranthe nasuta]
MALSKLNPLSFFPPLTLPPTPKPPISQLPVTPFKKTLITLHLKTEPMIPFLLPKQSLRTIIKQEEFDEVEETPYHEISDSPYSVGFPSLAFSNTLFFKAAYNVQVIVGEDESEEALVGRFRREIFRYGILRECRRRLFFECNQKKRIRKAKEAARRYRKRRPYKKVSKPVEAETPKMNTEDSADDNWEYLDIDLPYC